MTNDLFNDYFNDPLSPFRLFAPSPYRDPDSPLRLFSPSACLSVNSFAASRGISV